MKQKRHNYLLVIGSLLILSAANEGFAQVVSGALAGNQEPGLGKSEIQEVVERTVAGKTIRIPPKQWVDLEISAAKTPYPALKHPLFPSQSSLKKGDAVTFYHRAVSQLLLQDRNKNPRENRIKKQNGEQVPFQNQTISELSEWIEKKMTPAEISQLKKAIPGSDSPVFRELLLATKLKDCDWGFDAINDRPLWEYISFLLPEVQQIRNVSRYLALKAKIEIAEKRFDDAIETIRVGLKMAKSLEETRFLVCTLVGVACSQMMLDQARELVSQPGAPNLYWALETLPKPLINSRIAFVYELEYARNGAGLWFLQNPEQYDFSAEQWRERFLKDVQLLEQNLGLVSPGTQDRIGFSVLMLRAYPIAKRELIEWGYDPKEVEKMPVAKVVSIHQARLMRAIADEFLKLQNRDYREFQKSCRELEQNMLVAFGSRSATVAKEFRELVPIATLLLPAASAVIRAESRLQRRVAALQAIEAIRMHVAETGRLPASLNEITCVSVPINPQSQTSFLYRKSGDRYELWEMRPDEPGIFSAARIYRIRLHSNTNPGEPAK